jgi:enterochelin esterase-like enzyme
MATACAALLAIVVLKGCGSGEGQLFEKAIPAPSLRGNLIGEPVEQPIAVYVPPGYASAAEKYPVVYFVTGDDAGVDALLNGTFQGFSLSEAMDRLIAEGSIRKMIVVVVNGRNLLGEGFFTQSPDTGQWDRFLVRDVVRYVDKNYKTLPFRETRGIAGYATGGTAALQIAMRYTDVFSAVYAISPSAIDGVDERVREYGESELELEAVVIEVGTGEAEIVDGCKHISARMDEIGAVHRLIQFEGGHADHLRIRIEEYMLPFFSGVLGLE